MIVRTLNAIHCFEMIFYTHLEIRMSNPTQNHTSGSPNMPDEPFEPKLGRIRNQPVGDVCDLDGRLWLDRVDTGRRDTGTLISAQEHTMTPISLQTTLSLMSRSG